MFLFLSLCSFLARRAEFRADVAEVDSLTWAWHRACANTGLGNEVSTVTGPTMSTPKLVHVVLGPPIVLTVQLLPGQLPEDFVPVARRVAAALGARRLRVTPQGLQHVRVELLLEDPLDATLPLVLDPPGVGVLLGRDEGGQDILVDPADLPHVAVQGVTRSGKSVWTYGLLAQLAGRPDVLVAGLDPTGLLWRPFAGSRHADWQVSGLDELAAHEKLLARVVDEMDRRIRELPADRDSIEITHDRPLLFVFLEEYPGLLRVLDAAKTRGDDPGGRVRALISRLLAEGAKVGIRVVILAQRAEAAVLGAFERAMCSLRISFRCDNRTAVELLHAGADPAVADAHTSALPGVGLISMPGRPLTRFRAPYLGDYAAFAAAIATRS